MSTPLRFAAFLALVLSAPALAAQARFFITSPLAQPGAQDAYAAATSKVIPYISGANADAAEIPIQIWVQLNLAAIPPVVPSWPGGPLVPWALGGGDLDLWAGDDQVNVAGTLDVYNPNGRWGLDHPIVSDASAYAGRGGRWYQTAEGLPLTSVPDVSHPEGPIFLLFFGSLSKAAGALFDNGDGFVDLYLELPQWAALACNDSDYGYQVGTAFGWDSMGGEDTSSLYTDGQTHTWEHPLGGFYPFTYDWGGIRSDHPDLRIEARGGLPDPSTLALLSIGVLLARKGMRGPICRRS
ncbi:MAG: hypothetical protein L6Q92_04035 [Phycisphaerae bacterium]|nr:hypothetical protein [Phycisphaerae bacterium]